MIRCTTIGIEPSKMCYEICVCATRCGALKAWEKEQIMDEQKLHIQALKSVIDRLKREEPKCGPCEQCWYGYKFDEVSKQKCKELREEKRIEHIKWKERYDYWLKELDNAE